MARFDSLRHSPSDARRILRDRLRRFLPARSNLLARQQKPATRTTDEEVVHLLCDVAIDFADEEDAFRASYDRVRNEHPQAPSFEQLVAGGWLRSVWGRVSIPLDTTRLLYGQPDDLRLAVLEVLKQRHWRAIRPGQDAQVRGLAEQLAAERPGVSVLQSPSPSWVSARLWERLSAATAPLERLRLWLDRWHLLQSPEVTPGRDWDTESARLFAEAGFAALAVEPGFLGWETLRTHLVARIATASTRGIVDVDTIVPVVPASMFDRVRWLDNRMFDHANDSYDACGDLWGVTHLLLNEVADVDLSPSPHPLAKQTLDLAIDRPELLEFIELATHKRPELLADILLHPTLAAVACMWIAEWPPVAGAWDREVVSRDNDVARLSAFSDAVGVLGQHLETRVTPPTECSALLTWMHMAATASPLAVHQVPVVTPQMLAAMRGELVRLPVDIIHGIFDALAASTNGLGTPSFAAALDVLALGALADVVDPSPMVDGYVRSLRSRDYSVSAVRIEPAGAQALVQLAMRTDANRQRVFFGPLDLKNTLAGSDPNDAFSVPDGLARSLRAHIRILARAVTAWPDVPPKELVDALAASLRAGALSHAEKGKVSALGARHETRPWVAASEPPIASDIADAIVSMTGDARERIVAAVLETDEPMTLAQLLALVPGGVRERFKKRVLELSPQDAADVMTLTEAQARVEALLAAGLGDAAAIYMAAEQDLQTLGKVAGRSMTQLRARMRLHLLREEYDAILGATVPEDLPPPEQQEAADALEFYKGLALLHVRPPDAKKAQEIFERLHHRRPDIVSYILNMFAAATASLLAGDLFRTLRGAEVSRARRALADADAAMARARGASGEDRTIHECNRALVLLATGEPERAHQTLLGVSGGGREERVAAYEVVALSRMGRPEDAQSALHRAVAGFGRTELLEAARGQIRGAAAYDARPTTTTVEDPLPSLRAALSQILTLDAVRQAALFEAPPDSFDNLLINHVRAAAGSIVSLVPMMKDVCVDSCEDDLSALLLTILKARLEFIRWSATDQPRGGFTAAGNPGRRDIAIMRDSAILAVIEAVVCDRPATHAWTKGELTSHFQKLLGYETCRLFFHVTYSYVPKPSAVLVELRKAAEFQAPVGFKYLGIQETPLTDSRPTGFVATYRSDLGDIKVVFLLMDMLQQSQRDAAKLADASNPRKKGGS